MSLRRWLRGMRRAWSASSADLDYVHSAEGLAAAVAAPGERSWRTNPLTGVAKILVRVAIDLPNLATQRSAPPRCEHLVVAGTINQHHALSPLIAWLPNMAMAAMPIFVRTAPSCPNRFPTIAARLSGLLFLPKVTVEAARASGYTRSSYWYALDQHLEGLGVLACAHAWLADTGAATLTMANDHIAHNRALRLAAAELGIRTVYLQHASVNPGFPPLEFDLALLEGEAALDTYRQAGAIAGDVGLVGMPRYDQHLAAARRTSRLDQLGVSVNKHDPVDGVQRLLHAVATAHPNIQLALRPHPGDTRRERFVALARAAGARFSDAREESAFEFLASVDANVAGESSIHLEAALMNVTPLYMDLSGKALDWYGFVERGLVEVVADVADLLDTLGTLRTNRPDVRGRAHAFNAAIGSAWEGRSAELAAKLIIGDEPDATQRTAGVCSPKR